MQHEKLDRRITIQSQLITHSDSGEEVVEWSTVATVWAEKRENAGAERFAARQNVGYAVKTFAFRWSNAVSGITVEHRILFDGRQFNITDVREIGRRQGIEVDAWAAGELPLVVGDDEQSVTFDSEDTTFDSTEITMDAET
jgi:SPP1 family predicted phage head-tail adaptor